MGERDMGMLRLPGEGVCIGWRCYVYMLKRPVF